MESLLLSIKFADICGTPARCLAMCEVLGYKIRRKKKEKKKM